MYVISNIYKNYTLLIFALLHHSVLHFGCKAAYLIENQRCKFNTFLLSLA